MAHAKKKKRSQQKSIERPKTKLRNFKTTDAEWTAIRANAKKYANGNLSLWLRYAGMNHIPRKKDLK